MVFDGFGSILFYIYLNHITILDEINGNMLRGDATSPRWILDVIFSAQQDGHNGLSLDTPGKCLALSRPS